MPTIVKHSYFALDYKISPKVVMVEECNKKILHYPYFYIKIIEEPFSIKEMIDIKFVAMDAFLKVYFYYFLNNFIF